ncbi:hypothetical protein ACF1BQ_030290 [Bradyrhizobium sp. RDT10]
MSKQDEKMLPEMHHGLVSSSCSAVLVILRGVMAALTCEDAA